MSTIMLSCNNRKAKPRLLKGIHAMKYHFCSSLPVTTWTFLVYFHSEALITCILLGGTPYELVSGKVPNISHLKSFGCLMTILNTSNHLGKFEGKADEGFIVGYAAHSIQRLLKCNALHKADSDSECEMNNSDYAGKLLGFKASFEANATAETHLSQADLATSRNRVPAGKVDSAASVTDGPTDPSTPVFKPVDNDADHFPSWYLLRLQVNILSRYLLLMTPCKIPMSLLYEMEDNTPTIMTLAFSPPLIVEHFGVKSSLSISKGQPKTRSMVPRGLSFVLGSISDSDYCWFSGDRNQQLQKYVAAANCYGQAPFIRDANEKNLIQVLKIHTDENVADLLTKAFDGPRSHPSLDDEGGVEEIAL
ncbi:hypothetical protein Tco_0570029 [Tanacetum coccineum]